MTDATHPVPTSSPLPIERDQLPSDRHPALVYLAGLAPSGRRTQRRALDNIAELVSGGRADAASLPWHRLDYQHVQAIRTALTEATAEDGDRRFRPATVNKHLSALRGVLREAWRLGLMDGDRYQRCSDVKGLAHHSLPAGRSLDRGELSALFATCGADERPQGRRDAALLAVLYGCGLRRSEVVALDVTDYEPTSGALSIRQSKGRRDRMVYVTNGSRDALDGWLDTRGDEPVPLFVAINKAGAIDPQLGRLTPQAILYILQRRADQADVKQFSPHDLRRTFVGDMLDAGADLAMVQQLAGHAQPATTARYDRRPEEAKRRASELLHVPYVAG